MRAWKIVFGTATAALALSAGGAVRAVPSESRADGTRANLETALRSEAYAYAEYSVFAEAAQRSGHPEIAKLFRRVAQDELRDHFVKEARHLRLVRGNRQNLQDSIKGESQDRVDYGRWAREATADGCRDVAKAFTEIRKDEEDHLARYRKAVNSAVPSPVKVEAEAVRPGKPRCAASRTIRNLRTAMEGEALANAKYTLYSDHARSTGDPRLAALFKGAAGVELKDHFVTEANLVGLARDTAANLRTSITAEAEAIKMYDSYAKAAAKTGHRSLAALFREISKDETEHHKAFSAALTRLR